VHAGACKPRCANIFELSSSTWPIVVDQVGDVELVQDLAPAHDALALDDPGRLVGPLAALLPARLALAGALVLDVDDREPQQLDNRVTAGEVAAAPPW
jgi:hypothetical protein